MVSDGNAAELSPHGKVSAIDVVGVVALTLYSATASASFAALVFRGPAADGLARGVATFLLASGVLTVLLGWRTRFPLVFGVVQDTAAIVLVPAVATIAASGSDDPVRDVFVVLALSSLLTGSVLWLIGRAGLGGAARFMPTTVVAGFLAGTGWLLFKGGIEVMTDRALGLGDVDDLFEPELAKLWLPGLGLGLVVALVALAPRLSPLISSAAVVLGTAAFFVVTASVSSLDAVEAGGWVLGPFADSASIAFVGGDIANADWSAVKSTTGQIGVVVVLSLLGVLLNIAGIQSLVRRRIDLDAELQTVGISNMLVAPVGGLVGYHGLGDSALAHRLGVTRRWAPIAVGSSTAFIAFVGVDLIGYLPRYSAGGLLVGAGLGLLIDWLRELRLTTAWADRAVSVVILAVICFVGILEGIVVGIVAACIFFVIRYSRIDAVRIVSTGRERRSVVERTPEQNERLDDLGDRIVVYELHGSLFFGSVSGVASTIRERLARTSTPLDVVILDFARVADIDSSAFAVLDELADDIARADVRVVWSELGAGAVSVLFRTGRAARGAVVEDLDAALEAAEEQLLASYPAANDAPAEAAEEYSTELLDWFSRRRCAAGEIILREGAASDELVVLMSGSLHVSRVGPGGREIRLRTLRAGAIVGEIGFLTAAPRSATVTAETEVELLVLSSEDHARLRRERPDLAIELYDRVLRGTADRAAAIHRSLTQALR